MKSRWTGRKLELMSGHEEQETPTGSHQQNHHGTNDGRLPLPEEDGYKTPEEMKERRDNERWEQLCELQP